MSTNWLPYTRGCFVCGAHNPQGLRLRFQVVAEGVEGEFTPQVEQAGFHGIIHGGILATVLDEVMVWAASVPKKRFHFSVELTVRYSRPVTVGRKMRVVGRIRTDRGRLVETEGEMRDANGIVYAKARGKYMAVPAGEEAALLADFVHDPGTIPIEEIVGGQP